MGRNSGTRRVGERRHGRRWSGSLRRAPRPTGNGAHRFAERATKEVEKMFKDKTLLITGGTGTFGNAVLRRFLKTGIREIRVLSRDEKKQEDMRLGYNNPKLRFYIGDVRELDSVAAAMAGVDYVFHAAALEQAPAC